MTQGLQGFAADDGRVELLDALRALVEEALRRDPTSRDTARLDKAAARWSRQVTLPADVVTLVAEVRRQARHSRRREDVLERVALVAVTAVAERQVHEALTDPLTGLATRARMEDEIQHLLAMSLRAGSPLTAVILDVDGLKRINDEKGHAAGDAALAAVGQSIREHARQTDRAFRWGGDEFVLLMPGTTEADARLVVERIQRSCPTPTTAGVAMHADGADEVDVAAWLSEADADLYRRRSAARAVPAPRRGRPRQVPGVALLGLAAVAAATGGWFTASTATHSDSTGSHSTQRTSASGPLAAAPIGGGRIVAAPGTTVHAVPAVRTPTTVAPVVVPKPATSQPVAAPPVLVSPPVVPPVVTVVLHTPPAADPTTPTPDQAPQQTGLVPGLLATVGGVIRTITT